MEAFNEVHEAWTYKETTRDIEECDSYFQAQPSDTTMTSKKDDLPPKQSKQWYTTIDFTDPSNILRFLQEATLALAQHRIQPGEAKIHAYLCQTAQKILYDRLNHEGRISELEHIAGIKINALGVKPEQAKTAIIPYNSNTY